MLFAVEPVAGIDVLVCVDVHSLSFFQSSVPLAVIFAFIGIDQSADSMLKVLFKLSCVHISVGVSVFAFSLS